jgi:DNA-binding NtrC family response regulator
MGIIMTAFVESKAAINAIIRGYVYQFIKKALDSKRVKQTVAMAVDHYKINAESQKLRPLRQSPHHPPLKIDDSQIKSSMILTK